MAVTSATARLATTAMVSCVVMWMSVLRVSTSATRTPFVVTLMVAMPVLACPATPGTVCMNVDECAAGSDTCSAMASCQDTDGGFHCVCDEGYEGDGHQCTAVPPPPNPPPPPCTIAGALKNGLTGANMAGVTVS